MHTPGLTNNFLNRHLYAPALLFLGAALALEFSNLDLWLADLLYAWSGSAWSWRDAWLTSNLIHEGGRTLVGFMVLAVSLLLGSSFLFRRMQPWRKGLLFLLTSALACGVLINVLKQTSHIDCPWDLLRYGGVQAYVKNFSPLPSNMAPGACFPAGHASAGWAWVCLYFWALEHAWKWRRSLLVFVFSLGLVFGLGQELRGAHFLSHDVWTLGLSWLLSTLVYLWFYRSHSLNLYPPGCIRQE